MAENNSLAIQAQVTDIEPRVFSAVEMQQQVQAIQQVMDAVMKPDVHYGVIPGTGKKDKDGKETGKQTLLKAGAEKIMMTFRLGCDPEVEDLSGMDEARFRVRTRIFNILSGTTISFGIGEASSNETKYKWKAAYGNEYEEADPSRRKIKYYKDGGKTYQIRQEIADVANTVLKMAKKRSLVDGVLTATAASDVFDQDLEDMDQIPGQDQQPMGKPKVQQPKAKTTPADKPATPAAPAEQAAAPSAQPTVSFDPFKGKLKKETVAQILEMAHEMKWNTTKERAKFELYDGMGDEAALDSCQAEYRTYINGLK
jgi:hypothetical protein